MTTAAFPPTTWKGAGWEVYAENPAPGLLLARASGLMDMESSRHLMQVFDAVAAACPGRVDAFHDWEKMDGYTPEARVAYTAWSKAHPERVNAVNVLVQSRPLAMAVAVANTTLGGNVKVFSVREDWDLAFRAALQRRSAADFKPE